MKEELKNLLAEEIKSEIQDLSSLSPGSKEKSTAIEDLAKLYRLKIEETKNELDYSDKQKRRIMENKQHNLDVALKEKQMDNEVKTSNYDEQIKRGQLNENVKDRYFRLGIAAAEIILPLMFYATWMKRGFKFEENGTYTSTTFRGLFNRFKPTKK